MAKLMFSTGIWLVIIGIIMVLPRVSGEADLKDVAWLTIGGGSIVAGFALVLFSGEGR